MEIKHIKCILSILEEGNISKTAKKMYVSQPSLSQRIKAIERELGIAIFNRHSNPISLTYAGEKYVEAGKKVLKINENLIKEINEINAEKRGLLRIGISSNRAMLVLPKILPEFMQKYPLVEIQLVEEGTHMLSDAALRGRADLAFVNSDIKHSELEYNNLVHEEAILFCGRGTKLAQTIPDGETINILQAKNENFISLHKGRSIRDTQDKLFKYYDISPSILVETYSVEVARRLAISCNAVTLYPAILLDEMESLKELSVYYHIEGEQFMRDYNICYPKDAFLPNYMKEFIDIAKRVFRVSAKH